MCMRSCFIFQLELPLVGITKKSGIRYSNQCEKKNTADTCEQDLTTKQCWKCETACVANVEVLPE